LNHAARLVSAATSDAVPQSADAAADPVEHHAPAALDVLNAQHVAPRRRTGRIL